MINRINKFRASFLALFVLALLTHSLVTAASKAYYISNFGGLSVYFDTDTISTGDVLCHMTKDPATGTTLTGPARFRSYRAAEWPTETINLPACGDAVDVTDSAATLVPVVLDTANVTVPALEFPHDAIATARYTHQLPPHLAGSTENATVTFYWHEGIAESGKTVMWRLQTLSTLADVTEDVSPTYAEVQDTTSNDVDILHAVSIVQPLSTWGWTPGELLAIDVVRVGNGDFDNSSSHVHLRNVVIDVPISPVRE